MSITAVTQLMRLLSSPPRLRALHQMRERRLYHMDELLPVMAVEYSNGTKHLARLLEAGVLSAEKEGRYKLFYVRDQSVFELLDTAAQMTERGVCH